MDSNLARMLEKWKPGTQAKEQKEQKEPPKEAKKDVADSGTFDMDILQHLGEEPENVGQASHLEKQKKEKETGSQSQQSFNLDDKEIMEFFNQIETSKEEEEIRPLPQQNQKSEDLIKAAKQDPEKIVEEINLEEEPIEFDKADFLFAGGQVDVPDKATGDILQKIHGEQGKEEMVREEVKSQTEWSKVFPWDQEIVHANSIVFGFKNFRENQKEIINAAKSGRDVLGLIPTGGGKSLTFQICAVTDEGVTFVVMPLLSLIMDQINYLTYNQVS